MKIHLFTSNFRYTYTLAILLQVVWWTLIFCYSIYKLPFKIMFSSTWKQNILDMRNSSASEVRWKILRSLNKSSGVLYVSKLIIAASYLLTLDSQCLHNYCFAMRAFTQIYVAQRKQYWDFRIGKKKISASEDFSFFRSDITLWTQSDFIFNLSASEAISHESHPFTWSHCLKVLTFEKQSLKVRLHFHWLEDMVSHFCLVPTVLKEFKDFRV